MKYLYAFVFLVLCATATEGAVFAQLTIADPVVPAAAAKLFAEGAEYENRQQLSSAADSYRAAIKAADRRCLACLEALASVQFRMDAYKDSAGTDAAIAAQASDAHARAEAELREGMAFFQLSLAETEGRGEIDKNVKHADASLHKAEAILKQACQDDPSDEAVRMAHARVLAALKQDEEAHNEFAACAAMPGASQAECARALRFAKDVGRARGEAAPMFEAKTMDGTTFRWIRLLARSCSWTSGRHGAPIAGATPTTYSRCPTALTRTTLCCSRLMWIKTPRCGRLM